MTTPSVFVGADVGGTTTRYLVEGMDGTTQVATSVPTAQAATATDFASQIGDQILRLVWEATGGGPGDITSIGLGIAGPSDGRFLGAAPNIPALHMAVKESGPVPLAEMVSAKIGVPVVLGNDANLAALGEFARGAGQGADPMIYVTLSTGIGAGVVIGGSLLTGATGSAAEAGHFQIDQSSELTCGAGHRGDAEALAGGNSLADRAVAAIRAGGIGPDGLVSGLMRYSAGEVSAKEIFAEARNGDPLAMAFVADAVRGVGGLIGVLINAYNPSVIVFGGSVCRSIGDLSTRSDYWAPIFARAAESVVHAEALTRCGFRSAQLSEPGLVGAVALARQFAAAHLQSREMGFHVA